LNELLLDVTVHQGIASRNRTKATSSRQLWRTSDCCSRSIRDCSTLNSAHDNSTLPIDLSLPDSRSA